MGTDTSWMTTNSPPSPSPLLSLSTAHIDSRVILHCRLPNWYTDLNNEQERIVSNLRHYLREDALEINNPLTAKFLDTLGVHPPLTGVQIASCLEEASYRPVLFLKHTAQLLARRHSDRLRDNPFSANERLILSSISYLIFPDVVNRLTDLLPAHRKRILEQPENLMYIRLPPKPETKSPYKAVPQNLLRERAIIAEHNRKVREKRRHYVSLWRQICYKQDLINEMINNELVTNRKLQYQYKQGIQKFAILKKMFYRLESERRELEMKLYPHDEFVPRDLKYATHAELVAAKAPKKRVKPLSPGAFSDDAYYVEDGGDKFGSALSGISIWTLGGDENMMSHTGSSASIGSFGSDKSLHIGSDTSLFAYGKMDGSSISLLGFGNTNTSDKSGLLSGMLDNNSDGNEKSDSPKASEETTVAIVSNMNRTKQHTGAKKQVFQTALVESNRKNVFMVDNVKRTNRQANATVLKNGRNDNGEAFAKNKEGKMDGNSKSRGETTNALTKEDDSMDAYSTRDENGSKSTEDFSLARLSITDPTSLLSKESVPSPITSGHPVSENRSSFESESAELECSVPHPFEGMTDSMFAAELFTTAVDQRLEIAVNYLASRHEYMSLLPSLDQVPQLAMWYARYTPGRVAVAPFRLPGRDEFEHLLQRIRQTEIRLPKVKQRRVDAKELYDKLTHVKAKFTRKLKLKQIDLSRELFARYNVYSLSDADVAKFKRTFFAIFPNREKDILVKVKAAGGLVGGKVRFGNKCVK